MITVSRRCKRYLRLEIIKGVSFESDLDKVHQIRVKEPIYRKSSNGVMEMRYWQIPREDVGEILRRWDGSDILTDSNVSQDIEDYRSAATPISEGKRIKASRKKYGDKVLFPHQRKYVTAPADKRRLLNCFTTGLGKCLSSLARSESLGFTRMLIFTIDGVFDQWDNEIVNLFGESPVYYVGSVSQRKKLEDQVRAAKFVITTYGVGHEIAAFADFDSYIFDEAHQFQNSNTKLYKRLRRTFNATWKNNAVVQALTATPMGNLPSEMWSLVRLCHPLLAGSKIVFKFRYERAEDTRRQLCRVKVGDGYRHFYKDVPTKIKHQNRKSLTNLLASLMVRVNEDDATDHDGNKLKSYEDIDIIKEYPMTEYQEELFDQLKEDLRPEINGKRFKTSEARIKLLRLLQVGEGAYNIDPNDKHLRRESGKLVELKKKLKSLPPGEKRLVHFRFKPATKIMHRWFKDRSVIYNGDQNRSQKKLAKWAFHGLPHERYRKKYEQLAAKYNCPFQPGEADFMFLVIHEKTSLGMDLQSCHHQIFISFSFSGYAMKQTRGRICRIGQKAKKVITEYWVSNELERKFLAYVLNKLKQVRMSLDGQERLVKDQIDAMLDILRSEVAA